MGGSDLVVAGWVLEARLGSGAWGEVWKARRQHVDLRRALKLQRLVSDSAFTAWREEALRLEALSHPNIVRFYDADIVADGPYQGWAWIATELCDGSLADELAGWPARRLSDARCEQLVEQMLDALGAAHAGGCVHRDVKPANILRHASGAWKLADFGTARLVPTDDTHPLTGVVGTLPYMSPRACNGRQDHAADLYALGVTLHECLTGRRLHVRADRTDGQYLDLILHQPPAIESTLPTRWRTVVDALIGTYGTFDATTLATWFHTTRGAWPPPRHAATPAPPPPTSVSPPLPSAAGGPRPSPTGAGSSSGGSWPSPADTGPMAVSPGANPVAGGASAPPVVVGPGVGSSGSGPWASPAGTGPTAVAPSGSPGVVGPGVGSSGSGPWSSPAGTGPTAVSPRGVPGAGVGSSGGGPWVSPGGTGATAVQSSGPGTLAWSDPGAAGVQGGGVYPPPALPNPYANLPASSAGEPVVLRRIVAALVDLVLVFLLMAVLWDIGVHLTGERVPAVEGKEHDFYCEGKAWTCQSFSDGDSVWVSEDGNVLVVGYLVPALLSEVVLQGLTGWTVGKRLLGLRLVRSGGRRPGIGRALGRSVARVVDLFPCCVPIVGFVMVLSTEGHRTVADTIARTWVVRASPRVP